MIGVEELYPVDDVRGLGLYLWVLPLTRTWWSSLYRRTHRLGKRKDMEMAKDVKYNHPRAD